MTVGVDDELRIREYPGDDSATPRAYGFKILDPDDLRVTRTNADGTETVLVRGTHYSVSGAGNPTGGDVTPLAPIATGTSWRIEGDMALGQPTDYTAGDDFPAESHERGLDRSMIAHQEARRDINDTAGRALMVPRGEASATLPSAADRANRFQAYGPTGLPIASHGTGADQGLRADLGDEALGDAIILGDSGALLREENAARGSYITGGVLTAPLVLPTGKRHVGGGRGAPVYMTNEASGVEIPQPPGGDFNYHSVTENLFVRYEDVNFADCGDYANEIAYSGYGLSQKNTFWGGQVAAQRIRLAVGHMSVGEEIARSKVGQLFEAAAIGEGMFQSTVHMMVGGTTNLVGDAIKTSSRMDYYAAKGRAFDAFNKLFGDDTIITNASFDACWFEQFGPGTMTFTEAGGRVTDYAFNAGAGGGVFSLGKAIGPVFRSPTFVEPLTVSKGYVPIFDSPMLASGQFHVFSVDGISRDAFLMQNARGPNTGQVALDAISMTLPQHGSVGTLTEHFGRTASNTSLAIAEIGGVNFAVGMGHANLYTSELDGAAWTYKTATVTGGQADPWGGTTAFLFEGDPGQYYGNFYIPELSGGGKCCMQLMLRAVAPGNRIKLRIESTGANALKRHNTYLFTDTRWRIVMLTCDLPAAGDYTTYIEVVDGDFVIAGTQLSHGYDLPPILRGGQSVTGAYRQIDRRIVKLGTAIPVAGKWWAGDEIIYDGATAAARKRRGAICTVGDGTGVGTWVEYGVVANPGAAIPDIGGAPSQADHNAVLAALRAAGIIAP